MIKKNYVVQGIAIGISISILIVSIVPIKNQPQFERHFTNPNDTKRILVMSFNIHQAYNTEGVLDFQPIIDTIKAENPDIVGLQESLPTRQVSSNVNPIHKIAQDLGYYVYSGSGPQFQTPGVSILSKFPIIQFNNIQFTSQNLPRTGSHVRIQVSDQIIDFYSVHLAVFLEEDRIVEVDELLEFIDATSFDSTTPRIIVGDFNDVPNSTVYQNMINGGYTDVWTESGNILNATNGFTFHSYDPIETIDFIFVSNNPIISVNEARVISNQYGSDHLPIVADIELP